MRLSVYSILFLSILSFMACAQDDEQIMEPEQAETEKVAAENVFVLPIRKVKAGLSIDEFTSARDAYVALLEEQEGTLTDREIQPFFDFTFSGLPLDSLYIGLTSFQNQSIFNGIGEATNNSTEATNFFSKFDFIAFEVLQPLDASEIVDLSLLAPLGSNEVWEIAIRDISEYTSFDQTDYESKRDAYLAILAAQDGFIREIQWQSISNPNVVVGMTIYRDAQAVQDINNDQAFIDAYTATGFLQNYPPNKFGMISNVLK